MDNRKIKTNDIIEGLFKSLNNWVIIRANGLPLCWPGTIHPKVYSCLEDLMCDFDKEAGQSITTEYNLIMAAKRENENFDDYTASFYY